MAWNKFKSYSNIFLDDSNQALHAKLVKGLEKIESMLSGKDLLAAIAHTLHRLEIKPINGSGGSSTGYGTTANYVLLAQAIIRKDPVAYKNELTAALGNAQKAGVTKEHVARQLTVGLSPATYIGANNVGAPGPASTRTTSDAQLQLLDSLTSGKVFATRPPEFDLDIQRILRNWLTPGRGCPSDIEINVERPGQCWSDGTNTLRYPTICLAHELVHAWRGMTGKMLKVGSGEQGNNLEEVITTGLPPYNFEKFSENIFRSQFPDDPDMAMRTSY